MVNWSYRFEHFFLKRHHPNMNQYLYSPLVSANLQLSALRIMTCFFHRPDPGPRTGSGFSGVAPFTALDPCGKNQHPNSLVLGNGHPICTHRMGIKPLLPVLGRWVYALQVENPQVDGDPCFQAAVLLLPNMCLCWWKHWMSWVTSVEQESI